MASSTVKHKSETLKNNRYDPSSQKQHQWNNYGHDGSMTFFLGYADIFIL